jgi:hypothetical protein
MLSSSREVVLGNDTIYTIAAYSWQLTPTKQKKITDHVMQCPASSFHPDAGHFLSKEQAQQRLL